MKKSLIVIACAVCAMFALSCDYAEESVYTDDADMRASTLTLSTAPQMFDYVCLNYENTVGPISICKGTLTTSNSTKTIYLVALSGTEMKSGQATGLVNDLQAGCSIEGAYVSDVVSAIQSKVPSGSNLVLAGHSLGGMVAQQVSANSTIKSKYAVLNTVCFGSPLITFITREGAVQRLGDKSDVVPAMSVSSLFIVTSAWNYFGLNRENGGYGSDMLSAHKYSYGRSEVWGSWNAIGYKNSTGTITLNLSTKSQIAAPSGWKFFSY